MPILGILGGIAPESTIEYYRQILAGYRTRRPDGHNPPLIINSIDVKRMLDLIGAGRLEEVTTYLSSEIDRLVRAGADLGLLASNTPHLVFDELQRRSPMRLLSIVEATCVAARDRRLNRVGLLGTAFTMQAPFYPEVFAREGISVVPPEPVEQERVHALYMGELVPGVFKAETRDWVLALVERMRLRDGVEAVILAGTELPLLLREPTGARIPLLDTTRIHAGRAVDELLREDGVSSADSRGSS